MKVKIGRTFPPGALKPLGTHGFFLRAAIVVKQIIATTIALHNDPRLIIRFVKLGKAEIILTTIITTICAFTGTPVFSLFFARDLGKIPPLSRSLKSTS